MRALAAPFACASFSLLLAGCTGNQEVPDDVAYCEAVAEWDESHTALEEEVLELVNERRAAGASCGSEGNFEPTGPLTMNANLRCAARNHSKDMADNDYFSHDSQDGRSPGERIEQAEYDYSTWGENIAAGSPDAAGTVDQWMNSDGHCANIMRDRYTEIGVGYAPGGGYGHVWTQVFGAP